MMLGLYYMLARHEEETIRRRYGNDADDYVARVPMFNPFGKLREPGMAAPVSRGTALTNWLAIVAASLVVAFGLRAVAISQLYAVERPSPNVTALSFRAMSDDAIDSVVDSVLATGALQNLLLQNVDIALLMQINDGGSQLTHLLIDLGMKSEARRALDIPEDGYFVVVSQVVPRDSAASNSPGALSLAARIRPLLLVRPPDAEGDLAVFELTADQFYPSFARILF
jgi:hypothetical protein